MIFYLILLRCMLRKYVHVFDLFRKKGQILIYIHLVFQFSKRTITQFHYTAWPDHGTPEELELVQFHKAVTKKYQSGGLMLVHCRCLLYSNLFQYFYTFSNWLGSLSLIFHSLFRISFSSFLLTIHLPPHFCFSILYASEFEDPEGGGGFCFCAVCHSANSWSCNFSTLSARALIFHLGIFVIRPVQIFWNFWPWPWCLTYVSKT